MATREEVCSDCGVSFEEVDRRGGLNAIDGGHNQGCVRVTRYNEAVVALRAVFRDGDGYAESKAKA